MNSQTISIDDDEQMPIEQIAVEVAAILARRINPKDMLKFLQVVFLDVDEVAALLRVESKTIRSWVSANKIPYRKANGKVIFLLSEILLWTLPQNDRHARHRLTVATQVKIAMNRLAATCGKDV
jgi:excisionase family DNA binding protein